jgi:hypothetical protein
MSTELALRRQIVVVLEARTFDALWRAIGDIYNLFEPQECWNFLKVAGYASV